MTLPTGLKLHQRTLIAFILTYIAHLTTSQYIVDANKKSRRRAPHCPQICTGTGGCHIPVCRTNCSFCLKDASVVDTPERKCTPTKNSTLGGSQKRHNKIPHYQPRSSGSGDLFFWDNDKVVLRHPDSPISTAFVSKAAPLVDHKFIEYKVR